MKQEDDEDLPNNNSVKSPGQGVSVVSMPGAEGVQ